MWVSVRLHPGRLFHNKRKGVINNGVRPVFSGVLRDRFSPNTTTNKQQCNATQNDVAGLNTPDLAFPIERV